MEPIVVQYQGVPCVVVDKEVARIMVIRGEDTYYFDLPVSQEEEPTSKEDAPHRQTRDEYTDHAEHFRSVHGREPSGEELMQYI